MSALFKKSFFVLVILLLNRSSFGQSFPKYAAMVGSKESGQIKKGEFLAQQGVGGRRFIANNHWESIPIDSFNIIVLRDTITIFHRKIAGQFFADNLKSELKDLWANDKIIIYDIFGRGYGNKIIFIRPLEFTIE